MLDAADQDLVDAYLAKGGEVRRIPRGKSAYEITWDEDANALRYKTDSAVSGWMGGTRKKSPAVARRRAEVRRLFLDGEPAVQIAQVLDVPEHIVRLDATTLGLKWSEQPNKEAKDA